MFKKLFISVCLMFSVSLFANIVFAEQVSPIPHATYFGTLTQYTTSGYTLADGEVGVHGRFVSDSGFMNYRDFFEDIPVSSVTANFNFAIATTTLITGATVIYGLGGAQITQPTVAMNLIACLGYMVGNGTSTSAGSIVVSGVDARGNITSETFTASTTTATGNIAFSYIKSITASMTETSGNEDGSIHVKVGPGLKCGLSNDLQNSQEVISGGDIISVYFDDSGVCADDKTYTIDNTYDTILFATTPDGTTDHATVVYKVKKR